MKKNIKTFAILIMAACALGQCFDGSSAFAFGKKKAETVKAEKIKVKKLNPKKDEAVKAEKEAKAIKERESLIEKRKAQKALKKQKAVTVTAKTDKKQTSAQVIIIDPLKKEKNEKKEKKVKKQEEPKTQDAVNNVESKPENIKEVKEMKELAPLKLNGEDVFSASPIVEGSVATTKIISVDDCVKIALENNPTILSQMMSKDIYKNKIAQAWSNYFPTLSAGLSYSKNDMLMTNFKFPMQKYGLWNTPNLGFNQLIFDFGKTGAVAGVARKTYEAAENTMQANINDVVYQVKNSYYNLLYLQQQVEVYEDSVLQYQIHLKQAQAYYDIGSKAKIDVTTAAYNLDNTKLTLITARNSVDNGFASLTNAMGVPDFEAFSIKDRLDKKKYDIDFESAFETASLARPELLASKKKMEGSKLLIKSTKVAFLPDVKAFGNYTQGGKNPTGDDSYQIGAQMAYANVNLYLLKKQVDEAKLAYQKDLADYETQRQKVYLDVKQAYIQLRNAQQSIPVARSSMNMAKEQYDLASGRYKVGLGDAIELKDAENTYRTAKLQYFNTLMQYHVSAANLERVIGAPLTATEESL